MSAVPVSVNVGFITSSGELVTTQFSSVVMVTVYVTVYGVVRLEVGTTVRALLFVGACIPASTPVGAEADQA